MASCPFLVCQLSVLFCFPRGIAFAPVYTRCCPLPPHFSPDRHHGVVIIIITDKVVAIVFHLLLPVQIKGQVLFCILLS